MSYVIKEPDNYKWMNALSRIIGQNSVPWLGSNITITPFDEDSKNIGYVIKVNRWDHCASVLKKNNGIYCIITQPHWRWEDDECCGYIRFNTFDKTPNMRFFWETTIKLLRDYVDGEENLGACVW